MATKQSDQCDTLLIIDVQNGFVREQTHHIPSLVEKLQYDYKNVIATRFNNPEGSFYRTLIDWYKLKPGTAETDLAFKLRDDALLIEKETYTCVNQQFLDFVSKNNIECIDICGIDTEICVTKCAVDLFERGIKPVVLKDYCASTAGEPAHSFAFRTLERYIGSSQLR